MAGTTTSNNSHSSLGEVDNIFYVEKRSELDDLNNFVEDNKLDPTSLKVRGGINGKPFEAGGVTRSSLNEEKKKPAEYASMEYISRSLAALNHDSNCNFFTKPPGMQTGCVIGSSSLKSDENFALKFSSTDDASSVTPLLDFIPQVQYGDNSMTLSSEFDAENSQSNILNEKVEFDEFDNPFEFGFDDEDSSSDSEEDDTIAINSESSMLSSIDFQAKNVQIDIDAESDNFVLDGRNMDLLSQLGNPGQNSKDVEIDELVSHVVHRIQVVQQITHDNNKKQNNDKWAITRRTDTSNFYQIVPKMAMEFPFELDVFQKEAVIHLERNECVFIAAHTSAGKTVIAEYAIALSAKHMTRCVYTSPIKALSNQKFRDFHQKHGDVGLITGDVSINPDASCLVMTTEILRSMLYRGSDLIRDIEWVIFDEVHYLNDAERGVVWEEVIIMLPSYVNMIFLSATTPNAVGFSDWIGRTKRKNVFVISTPHRPVPLEHNLWARGKLHRVMDSRGDFSSAAHSKVSTLLKAKDQHQGGRGAHRFGKESKQELRNLIKYLRSNDSTPAVVFSFSKKRCEECAFGLSNLDFTSSSEKSAIHVFLETSLSRLQGTDRVLPQILANKDILKRGIAVHHGGLLPILKEIVEILFSRGLVKILFATETFAMGVNMPARTVVFSGTRKHDGNSFRDLLPGEYTQMAGRAGRRGLDTVGTVIIGCWTSLQELEPMHKMLKGAPTKLESQFRLTYTMMLNLLRVEDMTVEEMIKRSFSEVSTQKILGNRDLSETVSKADDLIRKLHHQEASGCCILGGPPEIEEYYLDSERKTKLKEDLQSFVFGSPEGLSAIQPGRVVTMDAFNMKKAVGIVLKSKKKTGEMLKYIEVLILYPPGYSQPEDNLEVESTENKSSGKLRNMMRSKSKNQCPHFPVNSFRNVSGRVVAFQRIQLYEILSLCSSKIKIDYLKMIGSNNLAVLTKAVSYLLDQIRTYPEGIPELDPIADLNISDINFGGMLTEFNDASIAVSNSKCDHCPKKTEQQNVVSKRLHVTRKVRHLKHLFSNENLALFPEFNQRLEVLEKLKYIDSDHAVLLKGRVACEINTANELVLTELIFENILASLLPEEIVSVLSALVFQNKTQCEPNLVPRLVQVQEVVGSLAENLGRVQMKFGIKDIDPYSFKRNVLHFGMMEVVYEWARGVPFKHICELTDVAEGTIVRTITRLDETCREVRNAARIIGDPNLYRKSEFEYDRA